MNAVDRKRVIDELVGLVASLRWLKNHNDDQVEEEDNTSPTQLARQRTGEEYRAKMQRDCLLTMLGDEPVDRAGNSVITEYLRTLRHSVRRAWVGSSLQLVCPVTGHDVLKELDWHLARLRSFDELESAERIADDGEVLELLKRNIDRTDDYYLEAREANARVQKLESALTPKKQKKTKTTGKPPSKVVEVALKMFPKLATESPTDKQITEILDRYKGYSGKTVQGNLYPAEDSTSLRKKLRAKRAGTERKRKNSEAAIKKALQ